MKTLVTLLLLAIIVIACNNNTTNEHPITSNIEQEKLDQLTALYDSLGPVIDEIAFRQKASGEDLKIFDDGIIPWISLENPQSGLAGLIDADKIVLPYSSIRILIDYPLNKPVFFELSSKSEGYSRKELILVISNKYHEIYQTEEKTAAQKTIPLDERKGLVNRNQTDGEYGIWGHDLSDLDLSFVEIHKNAKGVITLTLGIES